MMHRARYYLAVALGLAGLGSAHAAVSGQLIANNTPRFVATAKNLGPANPAQAIELSFG
jgi:hypothetical protein